MPATNSGRTARTPLYPPVQAIPPCSLPPPFFFLSWAEKLAKAGTCARDRRALQQLALNVHVKHSDLTWPHESGPFQGSMGTLGKQLNTYQVLSEPTLGPLIKKPLCSSTILLADRPNCAQIPSLKCAHIPFGLTLWDIPNSITP